MKQRKITIIFIFILILCSSVFNFSETNAATKQPEFSYSQNGSRSIKKETIKKNISEKIKNKIATSVSQSNIPIENIKKEKQEAPISQSSSLTPLPPTPLPKTQNERENTNNDTSKTLLSSPTIPVPEPIPQSPVLPTTSNPKLSKFISRFDEDRYTAAVIIDNNCQEKYGCNPYLMMSIIKRESNVHNWRINNQGAAGIAQFLPETARGYGLFVPDYKAGQCEQNNSPDENGMFSQKTVESVACDTKNDERFNPEKAIKAMIQKIKDMIYKNDGNQRMAMANYNGGWWPSFFKQSFEKDTQTCINEIISQSTETFPDTFLVVKKGATAIYGGMNPFFAPNDKYVSRNNIKQVCAYANEIISYKSAFTVGQWP